MFGFHAQIFTYARISKEFFLGNTFYRFALKRLENNLQNNVYDERNTWALFDLLALYRPVASIKVVPY